MREVGVARRGHHLWQLLATDRILIYIHTPYTYILVEMLNIVGERERPNLGFSRDVRAA